MNYIRLDQSPSTNSYLKEWSDHHPMVEQMLVFTSNQTAGRGQRGNSWESEPEMNLAMSVLLKPHFVRADQQFILSQIASLSVKNVLSKYADNIAVKWPNDVYWQHKKMCGILIENDLMDGYISRSIIGIGLNLNQQQFVSDAPNPVSLTQVTHEKYDIESFAHVIYDEICMQLDFLKKSTEATQTIQAKYAESLYRKDGFHFFESSEGQFRAKIDHIEPSGLLALETENNGKIKFFAFKEVKFIIE